MTNNHSHQRGFLLIFLGITAIFIYTIQNLVTPLFYGMVFAIVLYPLFRYFVRLFKGREVLAALISILAAVLVLGLFIYVIGGLVLEDALNLINVATHWAGSLSPRLGEFLARVREWLPEAVASQLTPASIQNQIAATVRSLAGSLVQSIQALTGNVASILALALVSFYATFYFLKNGQRWSESFLKFLPLTKTEGAYLAERFVGMTKTALRMVFVMGAVQGFLGGLIFTFLGIPSPFFWGLVFGIASLVPGVGHAIVWLPTAIVLLVSHETTKALILIAYGLIVMGFADDLLRPYLIGRSVKIHPFLVLIATLGGISVFGFAGLLIGPIVAALTLAVWQLYERRHQA